MRPLTERQAYHLHSRDHHRMECRCLYCRSDGAEPCSEDQPCQTCVEARAAKDTPCASSDSSATQRPAAIVFVADQAGCLHAHGFESWKEANDFRANKSFRPLVYHFRDWTWHPAKDTPCDTSDSSATPPPSS